MNNVNIDAIDSLIGNLNGISTEIGKMKTSVSFLKGDTTALTNYLKKIQDQASSINTDISNIKRKIQNYKSQVIEIENKYSTNEQIKSVSIKDEAFDIVNSAIDGLVNLVIFSGTDNSKETDNKTPFSESDTGLNVVTYTTNNVNDGLSEQAGKAFATTNILNTLNGDINAIISTMNDGNITNKDLENLYNYKVNNSESFEPITRNLSDNKLAKVYGCLKSFDCDTWDTMRLLGFSDEEIKRASDSYFENLSTIKDVVEDIKNGKIELLDDDKTTIEVNIPDAEVKQPESLQPVEETSSDTKSTVENITQITLGTGGFTKVASASSDFEIASKAGASSATTSTVNSEVKVESMAQEYSSDTSISSEGFKQYPTQEFEQNQTQVSSGNYESSQEYQSLQFSNDFISNINNEEKPMYDNLKKNIIDALNSCDSYYVAPSLDSSYLYNIDDDIKKYINLAEQALSENKKIYVLFLNPYLESLSSNLDTMSLYEQIEKYNAELKKAFENLSISNVVYVDVYSLLKEKGYQTLEEVATYINSM